MGYSWQSKILFLVQNSLCKVNMLLYFSKSTQFLFIQYQLSFLLYIFITRHSFPQTHVALPLHTSFFNIKLGRQKYHTAIKLVYKKKNLGQFPSNPMCHFLSYPKQTPSSQPSLTSSPFIHLSPGTYLSLDYHSSFIYFPSLLLLYHFFSY